MIVQWLLRFAQWNRDPFFVHFLAILVIIVMIAAIAVAIELGATRSVWLAVGAAVALAGYFVSLHLIGKIVKADPSLQRFEHLAVRTILLPPLVILVILSFGK